MKRNSKSNLTIAIITKNRLIKLDRCLASISNQTVLPVEIIIIDNDPQETAKKIIKKYTNVYLKISYFKKLGSVPHCRNFALQKVKTKYLGFVDDDCVLDPNWAERGLKKITHTNTSYVLGLTKLFNPQNIVALAQHSRDSFWKKYNLNKYYPEIREVFDTKNVILKIDDIRKNKLSFDEKCQVKYYDSADFDFGFQLNHKKIMGSFEKEMVLFHEETEELDRFVNRARARGKLAAYLNNKWHLNDRLINKKDASLWWWILRFFKHFYDDYQLYSFEIGNGFIRRLQALFFIKIFERHYALGYVEEN